MSKSQVQILEADAEKANARIPEIAKNWVVTTFDAQATAAQSGQPIFIGARDYIADYVFGVFANSGMEAKGRGEGWYGFTEIRGNYIEQVCRYLFELGRPPVIIMSLWEGTGLIRERRYNQPPDDDLLDHIIFEESLLLGILEQRGDGMIRKSPRAGDILAMLTPRHLLS